MKILLIDDDESYRMIFSQILKKLNTEVLVAPSSVEAIALASAYKFEFIISDYHLGELDGIELIKKLKESALNSKSTYIMVSGKHVDDIEANNFGLIDKYFMKPILPKQLLNYINQKFYSEEISTINKLDVDEQLIKHINLNYLLDIARNDIKFVYESLSTIQQEIIKYLHLFEFHAAEDNLAGIMQVDHKLKSVYKALGYNLIELQKTDFEGVNGTENKANYTTTAKALIKEIEIIRNALSNSSIKND